MNWKIFAIVCFVLVLPVIGFWLADSNDYGQMLMFSKEKKAVETVIKDDLFGDETIKTEWEDGFWLGLMPPTDEISPGIVLGVVPMSAFLIGLGAIGLFMNYRKKKIIIK